MRVGSKGGRGRIQKTIKKCHEINKIATLTLPKNSFQNAIKTGIFLLSSIAIWIYWWGKTRVNLVNLVEMLLHD